MLWAKILEFLKMDEKDGGDGSGGGGGGDTSKGANLLDENDDKAGDNAGDKGAGAGASKVSIPENWKEAIPEEFRTQGIMGNIKTVDQLAKAFVNAQKLVGAEKIAIPGKNAPPEELRGVYKKLGLPETENDYKFEMGKDVPAVDKDFVEGFRKEAFATGILPGQAQKMAEWFAKKNDAEYQTLVKQRNETVIATTRKLEDEWGDGYDEEMAAARAGLRDLMGKDKETAEYVKKMGLQQDYTFIKMMHKYGKTLGEDRIRGEGGGTGKLTPDAAKAKIGEIKAKGAYFNPDHADHAMDKAEVNRLYAIAHPGPAKVKSTPKE